MSPDDTNTLNNAFDTKSPLDRESTGLPQVDLGELGEPLPTQSTGSKWVTEDFSTFELDVPAEVGADRTADAWILEGGPAGRSSWKSMVAMA